MTLGFMIYRRGANVVTATAFAVLAMYLTIWLGSVLPFSMPEIFGIPPTGIWTIILLIYAWIASILPVTVLLQPRDYINAWQLFIMMALLAAGVFFASFLSDLSIVAPAVNLSPKEAPPIWPFLFVTIACGAISGFHSLVASGTSPKQVSCETDCQFVGYGSMLLEGALAVLVLICVSSGIAIAYETSDGTVLTGIEAWNHHYYSWQAASGLQAKLNAVVYGAANLMNSFKLSGAVGLTLMGVFIASFAGTTLDTSVRIQRYIICELAADLKIKPLTNRYSATTFAVLTAAGLAFAAGADGNGAMVLWPLFGTANQLLAALALLVVTMYLKRRGGLKFIFTAVPCLIMLVITSWAMVENEKAFIEQRNWLLVVVGSGIFCLAVWVFVEALIAFFTGRRTG
ncbi:Pyruvate/proton symporter BtsT [subsurface metagenome]